MDVAPRTPADDGLRAYREEVVARLEAVITALTDAARLQRPRTGADDEAEWTDWAELVAVALAGAAANVGGVEAVLAGSRDSWEARAIRRLLRGTIGPAGAEDHAGEEPAPRGGEEERGLWEHRTEPVAITVDVGQILARSGNGSGAGPDERRHREWAAYGDALKARIESEAAAVPGLSVPVLVFVDLRGVGARRPGADPRSLEHRLLEAAIRAVPAPGDVPGDAGGPTERA
ncbi:hypothetical protein [Nocardioides lianchengensis]|uniref:Uncharacterized protein n=1 Tax=Nocardioides lianchengensis TaxID=1045774 RepID=A0A1G6WC83_9ACTN|nr:hypothetical protein [Nocardioides lianchengensis]NYG09383.1 hypothetical protein [Nocardioides lianchengensis]SDD62837.1 hypothetical protein SAMN05421872_109226 [Nocardioides lianchengensis]